MNEQSEHTETIRRLEEQLLYPEVRRSVEQLDALLADEFIEFGRSGRIYNKALIIETLQQEAEVPANEPSATLQDFCARELASHVVLATYRTVRTAADQSEQACTLRSSIWKFDGEGWRMVFHQGTPSRS